MKKFKRIVSILISVVMIVSMMAVGSFAENPTQDKNIIILATSDIHGAIEQVRKDSNGNVVETGGTVTQIGFSGLKAYSDALKADTNNSVLLVDNGDAIQGTMLAFLTKGKPIAEIMNGIGNIEGESPITYDVMVPGNHDFDYTADYFFANIITKDTTGNRYISCNIQKKVNGSWQDMLAPYVIKDCGNTKVAFVGITTPTSLVTSNPKNFMDEEGNTIYDFYNDDNGTKLYKRVQESVEAARKEGADYVVAVGHVGDNGNNPWKSSDIIAHTDHIDVFIDGHSHSTFNNYIKNEKGEEIPCIAMGTKFANIGKIEINTEGTITISNIKASEITSSDAGVEARVKRENDEIAERAEEIIGESKVNLTINGKDGERAVRKEETNLGDFIADAYRALSDADVGLANGGAIRADIPKGEITMKKIFEVHPFGNGICVCEATGQQILDALEIGARDTRDSENGGFLQVSGLTYKIDTSIKSTVIMDKNSQFVRVDGDRRVFDVKINGQDIDPNKTYTVASHSYLIKSGGDGINVFMNSKLIRDEFILDNESLINFIKQQPNQEIGEQYAEAQSRIIFAKKPVAPQKTVETGDQTNVFPYVLCAAAALILIILLVIIKKKK